DCGTRPKEYGATRGLICAYVPLLMKSGRYPSTLANLSEILFVWGERKLGIRLLKKYACTVTTMTFAKRLWLTLRLYLRFRTRCRAAVAGLVLWFDRAVHLAWHSSLQRAFSRMNGSRLLKCRRW